MNNIILIHIFLVINLKLSHIKKEFPTITNIVNNKLIIKTKTFFLIHILPKNKYSIFSNMCKVKEKRQCSKLDVKIIT